jgi:hypothetical protein
MSQQPPPKPASLTSPTSFEWEVRKNEKKRLVGIHSKTSFIVKCIEGFVVVMEGDMAHPTGGDGRVLLKENEGQVFSPTDPNELYVRLPIPEDKQFFPLPEEALACPKAKGTCSST